MMHWQSGSPGNTIKDVTKDDVLKIYDAFVEIKVKGTRFVQKRGIL